MRVVGGGGASAFATLTSLLAQPFSKTEASFLDVQAEGPFRPGLLPDA